MSIRSNAPIALAVATAVNRNVYDNKTLTLTAVAGLSHTLPEARGTGARFKFVVLTALTSGSHVISATLGSTFVGGIIANNTGDSTPLTSDLVVPAAADNTYTLAFASGQGTIGDWVEFEDVALDKWLVTGAINAGLDPVTPFSTV